jgi:RimJ/RimL family protein N-acetyltransferase
MVCELSAVAWNPRWAEREIIIDILAVAFRTHGFRKVYTTTPHDNLRALRFNKGIGFKQEAILSEHYAPRQHAVICGMKRAHYDNMVNRFRAFKGRRAIERMVA